jgi:hypothetical protein
MIVLNITRLIKVIALNSGNQVGLSDVITYASNISFQRAYLFNYR